MKARSLVVVFLFFAVLANGCGTVCNLASGDPQVPLGGVRADMAVILNSQNESASSSSQSSNEAGLFVLGLIAAELGLSCIGDMLTFPLAIYMRQNDKAKPGGKCPEDPERQDLPPQFTAN